MTHTGTRIHPIHCAYLKGVNLQTQDAPFAGTLLYSDIFVRGYCEAYRRSTSIGFGIRWLVVHQALIGSRD